MILMLKFSLENDSISLQLKGIQEVLTAVLHGEPFDTLSEQFFVELFAL